MTPEQIAAGDAKLAELNAESVLLLAEINERITRIGTLSAQHRAIQQSAAAAQDEATRAVNKARREADAILQEANAAAKSLIDAGTAKAKAILHAAEDAADDATRAAQAAVAEITAQVATANEERQLFMARRQNVKAAYDTLHETVGVAKKERERAERIAAEEAARKAAEQPVT